MEEEEEDTVCGGGGGHSVYNAGIKHTRTHLVLK